MNCMKCGREIPLGQVFCKECLADMDTAPVAPGTPIHLPQRQDAPPPRRPVKKARKPEEVVELLKKMLLASLVMLLAVTLAFAITVKILVEKLEDASSSIPPGQNYSTSSSDETQG